MDGTSTTNNIDKSNGTMTHKGRWQPIMYEIYEWADGAGKDRLTLDIWMGSGCNDRFSYRVVGGGEYLELCVCVPLEMYSKVDLHKGASHGNTKVAKGGKKGMITLDPEELENYILKAVAMRHKMKMWCDSKMGTTVHGHHTVTTKIPLPKACMGNMDNKLLGNTGEVQVLEINLYVCTAEDNEVTYGKSEE